jgi:hypothetical protein
MKNRIPILILAAIVLLCSNPWSGAASLTTATGRWAGDAFGKARPSEPASGLPQPGEFWLGTNVPFSFVYNGKGSETLLGSWTR